MRSRDLLGLALESLRLHRVRTGFTLTGIAIGVTAVLLLTTLGEAAKRYVVQEFANVGSNLVIVMPGRTETSGGIPMGGGTTRDITAEDATALLRRVPAVRSMAPLSVGTAQISYGRRNRDARVYGTTAELLPLRKLELTLGRFLPAGDVGRADAVAVVGSRLARELFPGENPLGRPVRIGDWRFRVIGVLAPKGHAMGMDYDDCAIVPAGSALRMFNQSGYFRLLLQAGNASSVPTVVRQARAVLRDRHDGEEDFTIITPDAMLETFGAIIDALTAALAGIAAISLAVAGIGIMNVMLVSVSERSGEVGLFKALGARRRQILSVFLTEAVLLSGAGALIGIVLGVSVTLLAAAIWPHLPLQPSPLWISVVSVLALASGVGFGLLPARRAARLQAAEALRGAR